MLVRHTHPPRLHVDPDGWLAGGVRSAPSPHFDVRPAGSGIEVVILHAISLPPGEFGGDAVERLFLGRLDCAEHPYYADHLTGARVSSHLFIRRNGEIVQFVPFGKRAWHAGVSCCEGRAHVNDFSVGIELEGSDTVPFEDAQYVALSGVLRAMFTAWPALSPSHVYGHSDIAPGRKTDPGPCFDWRRLRSDLESARSPDAGRIPS